MLHSSYTDIEFMRNNHWYDRDNYPAFYINAGLIHLLTTLSIPVVGMSTLYALIIRLPR